MKCKICGYEISLNDTKCPGCDTSVEELKQANNIMSNVESNATETVSEPALSSETQANEEVAAPVEENSTEAPVENTTSDVVADAVGETATQDASDAVSEEVSANQADIVIGAPLDSNVSVDAASNAETKVEEPKKKKGGVGKVILIILLLVILAAVGVLGYFFLIYGKPSAVLSRAMNDTLVVTQSNDRFVNVKANVEVSNDDISNYVIDSKVDLTNLVSETDILVGKSLKNVKILNDGENSYVKFDEIYANSIKFEDSLLYEKLNYSNYVPFITHMNSVKNIISEIKNVLPNVIDESKLTREFTTVTVDQKNMGSTKFGYKLDQTDTNKFMLNLATEVKKNKTIMTNLMTIYTLPEADVAELVDGFVRNLSVNGLEFNLYTDYLTNKYYMAEVIVKGINNIKLTIKFDDNNKVNSISALIGSDQIDITNNYRHIEVLRTVNGRVTKYVLEITYTVIPEVEIIVPEEFSEYTVLGKESLEASIATDKALTDAYNLIVKDANVLYVAPEVPETEPLVDAEQTVDTETNTNQE